MEEVLIGTVLGDGYLEPHGKGVRLEVMHSTKQEAYIKWKREKLLGLRPSPIHYCAVGKYTACRFVTRIHPHLSVLREMFYKNGRKIVPENIEELLTSPQSLAVWFMDDGTSDKRYKQILFETQAFSIPEIERLQRMLWLNFKVKAGIIKSGVGQGLRLHVPIRESKKLIQIIEPYVIPEMKHKLP